MPRLRRVEGRSAGGRVGVTGGSVCPPGILSDVKAVTPKVFADRRGSVMVLACDEVAPGFASRRRAWQRALTDLTAETPAAAPAEGAA